MIKRLAILTLAAIGVSTATAEAQYFDIEKGNDAYSQSKYDEAKATYDKVIAENKTITDQKEAIFNKGNVAFREEKYDDAEKQYNAITGNGALPKDLRAQAAYNRGNTFYRRANSASNPSEKMDLLGKAVQGYKESLALSPSDREAKINYEFAQAQLKALEKQQKKEDKKDDKKDQEKEKQQQKQEEQKKEKEDPQKQQQPEKNNFSKDQAERILNALKQDEKNMLKKYQNKAAARTESEKDW